MRSDPDARLNIQRLCAQLGVLAGLAGAVIAGFSLGPAPARAGGQPQCPEEGECTFKKPNILFVLEYSTAMNQPWDGQQSRWEVAVETLSSIAAPGGFLSQNGHLALLRFGHDPDPGSEGTTISGDVSGLVDGLALDLEWDDEQHVFKTCAGQELLDALAAVPAPLGGMPQGIGAWTRGALERAAVEIAQTQADHPEDEGERQSMLLVVGSGIWTSADGQVELGPPSDDPTPVAAQLLDDGVETHVLALTNDPTALAAADALAAAGGTIEAFDDPDSDVILEALALSVQEVIDAIVACPEGLPRVMILLDASSSMLNVDGGFGAIGETAWDQLRVTLGGDELNLFDVPYSWATAADAFEFGLAVFGDPDEQRVLAQYDRCLEDAFEWALDPQTACKLPGCDDPWGGPPIDWTFTNSAIDLPNYPLTYNHMPACHGEGACAGSGSYVHLGLELVAQNQAEYHLGGFAPNSPYTTSDASSYVNILITDGTYAGYSTDAQVQAALEDMFAVGITTHVIGFGEAAQTQAAVAELEAMADWGSGGALDHHAAPTVAELELAFSQIVESLEVGPCCSFNDCDSGCPPWGDCTPIPEDEEGEPDEGAPEEDGDPGDGDGDGDDDPGDGDGDPGDGDESSDGDGDPDPSESGDSTEGSEPTDESGSDDESSGGLMEQPVDDSCRCNTSTSPRAWPALLLLAGLGLRRRQRA